MDYQIDSIILNDRFNHYDAETVDFKESTYSALTNLSKINIFIGPNNSGKSYFLRHLSATEKLTYRANVDHNTINNFINDCQVKLKQNIDSLHSRGTREISIESVVDLLIPINFHDEGDSLISTLDAFFEQITSNSPISFVRGHTRYTQHTEINEVLRNSFAEFIQKKMELDEKIKNNKRIKFKRLYIPTLRGLRCFNGGTDCYFDRTKTDYYKDGFCPDIFTGLAFYSKLKDLLLGDLSDRDIVIDFQLFLSENFFSNQTVALIPRKDDDVIYVKIGNEEEFPIYKLGDGIQSIICLTFPLFINKNENLLVFIEEPELYMHPGLQRVLLNTLMKRFEKHQYFLTTHSNHFLDLTLDYRNISIYTFQKELNEGNGKIASAQFKIDNVNNDDLRTLELLGVKNSSVFLSNCTIWVEGITDRKYLQHCVDLYHKHRGIEYKYKLDTHYSFVEYSGGNIVHWSFLDESDGINVKRLCGKLFLVSDRDKRGSYKDARHAQLKTTLGDRYYVLACREMENSLTPKVIANILRKYENNEALSLPNFGQNDYKEESLGRYIENVLLKGNKKRNGKYADKSGTITQKYRFWEDAISEIRSYDDLSDEIKKLVKRISSFIAKNNDAE